MEKLNLNPAAPLEAAPGRTEFDCAITDAKAGTLAIPPISPAMAFLDVIVAPACNKRLMDWVEQMRSSLDDLSHRVGHLTSERLARDEAFQSAFHLATHVALRTHQREKIDTLRNAVLNVAIGNAPSDDLQLIFLNFVDSFTPTHLQILALFDSKDQSGRANFTKERELSDQAIRDLRDRGLLRDTRAYVAQNRETTEPLIIFGWETTNFGRQFLNFVKSPL
jgi:hypothetical protein